MPTTSSLSNGFIERDKKSIVRPTKNIPLAIRGGTGATIYDFDGREYIDLTSGWNVVNTGWNHPKIIKALRTQAETLSYAPPWCTHQGKFEMAEIINALFGDKFKVLCGTTGSESVETALKIARRATGRKTIIGFTGAYHGGTLGSMLASGLSDFKDFFPPESAYHRYLPLPHPHKTNKENYISTIRNVILQDPKPAAIILEPIFTNPGVIYGSGDFYLAINEACKEVGALIIMDEVGTGFARTGKMFGFEHWPIQPDIICLSKAISSGAVPMAGTMMRSDLADSVSGAGFSYTFGWTPLACAVAKATLQIITEESLIEKTKVLGIFAKKFLEQHLTGCKYIADIRGVGLEIGIELTDGVNKPLTNNHMDNLTLKLRSRGVFAEYSHYTPTLLLMPPLIIEEDKLKQALTIIIEEINSLNL